MPFDAPTPTRFHPCAIAPATARRVSATYRVEPEGGAFRVVATVTWKNSDADWDGEWIVVGRGLSQSEADAMASGGAV